MKNLLKDLDIYLPGPPYVRFFFFVHTVSGAFSIHTAKYGFQAIYGQALFAHFSVAIFGPYLASISIYGFGYFPICFSKTFGFFLVRLFWARNGLFFGTYGPTTWALGLHIRQWVHL